MRSVPSWTRRRSFCVRSRRSCRFRGNKLATANDAEAQGCFLRSSSSLRFANGDCVAPRASARMRSSLLGSFAVIRRRASRSCAGQFVRLGRHDEVVLVETFYFLGLPRDLGPAPSEADIGMVALALGQTAEPGYEVQGFL